MAEFDGRAVTFALKRIGKHTHDWKKRLRCNRWINIDNYVAKIEDQLEILKEIRRNELSGDKPDGN